MCRTRDVLSKMNGSISDKIEMLFLSILINVPCGTLRS